MPTRNIVKHYGSNEVYHVYNRGVNKMPIFSRPSDYWYLLSLFKRHLQPDTFRNPSGRESPNYYGKVELLAFCLMNNHYHLLILNIEPDGIEKLMRSVMTAYTMYYNRRYKRVGSLFQNHYLAAHVSTDEYLLHVSRYIHLNPSDAHKDPFNYQYSSLSYYIGDQNAPWIHTEMAMSGVGTAQYQTFMHEGVSLHDEYKKLKSELAA